MDNKKLGELIYNLRKEKEMTQKQLAEKLNVTDKAVSKWERGNGYPEITIIPELAETLGITANELLCGQRSTKEHIELDEVDEIVSDAIMYIEKIKKIKTSNVFVIISVTFLLSVFVCLLCNYAINRNFDWSLYPTGGLIVAWLIITPLILLKKHRFLVGLIGMIVSTLPYLFLIEYLCPAKGWVIPMALPITGIAFVSFLIVIALFVYTRINRYYVVAITTFLFGVIANLITNNIVSHYLEDINNNISVVITSMSFALISVLFAIVAYFNERKRSD